MQTDYTKCNQNGRLLKGCRQEYSPVNFKEMQKIIFKQKPGKTLAKLKDSKDSHIQYARFASLIDITILLNCIVKSPQYLQISMQFARL